MSDELAEQYREAVKAGQSTITEFWRRPGLTQKTKAVLVDAGYYSPGGTRKDVESTWEENEHGEFKHPDNLMERNDAVETLEYNIGVLKLCATSKLPSRYDINVEMSRECLTDEVIEASAELVLARQWQDPAFLRLALYGIRAHQMANILTRIPALPRPSGPSTLKAVGYSLLVVIYFSSLIISPLLLALALAFAAKSMYPETVAAMYGLGLVIWAYKAGNEWASNRSPTPSADELAYETWGNIDRTSLQSWYSGGQYWAVTGTGAAAYLNAAIQKGIRIPPGQCL